MLILTARPACCAASSPFMTTARSPRRVIALKLAGSRLSIDTLIRRTPALARSSAEAVELRAIGGQRQFAQRARLEVTRELADQRHQVSADERLAAGQPDLTGPTRDEGAAQALQLLERQEIALRQELHILRHAVDAAKIAAIGDRNADIIDMPAVRVDQRRTRFRGRDERSLGVCGGVSWSSYSALMSQG